MNRDCINWIDSRSYRPFSVAFSLLLGATLAATAEPAPWHVSPQYLEDRVSVVDSTLHRAVRTSNSNGVISIFNGLGHELKTLEKLAPPSNPCLQTLKDYALVSLLIMGLLEPDRVTPPPSRTDSLKKIDEAWLVLSKDRRACAENSGGRVRPSELPERLSEAF